MNAKVSSMPQLAILMATYNGQKYLNEQLDSFASQTFPHWKLHVSDDGSTDDTISMLKKFVSQFDDGRLVIKKGPQKGFAANFLSMICDNDISADYYAFSDQDDIWEKDKLQRAVDWLQTFPDDVPALHASRTQLVDEQNNPTCLSPLYNKKPCFQNAIVQSIAGGNTMVMNRAARNLICKMSQNIGIKSHDWWCYLVITGCGGQFYYDQYCSLRYRQHSSNLTGMNTSLSGKLFRIYELFKGRFRNWNTQNTDALLKHKELLTPENQKILDAFILARNSRLISRLIGFLKIKIHRQNISGNIALAFAAIFNKV